MSVFCKLCRANHIIMVVAIALHCNLCAVPSLKHTLPKVVQELGNNNVLSLYLPEPQKQKPIGEKSFFIFGGVTITNEDKNFNYLSKNIFTELIGKRISLKEFLDKVSLLEQQYIKLGYFLTRIIVPPQTIENNHTIQLTLIKGYIEEINVDKLPHNLKQRVKNILSPIANDRSIDIHSLEHYLKIAMKIPGLQLKSTLGSGQLDGGAILFLNGTHDRYNLLFNYDNNMSKIQGGDQIVSGIYFNNLLSLGEQLHFSYGFDPSSSYYVTTGKRHLISSRIELPLDLYSTKVFIEATRSTARQYTNGLKIINSFSNFSTGITHFLRLRRNGETSITLSLNAARDEQTGHLRHLNILRMLNVILNTKYKSEKYKIHNDFSIKLTTGLSGLGSKKLDSSRQGTTLNFSKIEAEYLFAKYFGQNNVIKLNCKTQQTIRGAMFSSEHFNIASADYLSGYHTGSISADEGYVIRTELMRKIYIPDIANMNHNLQPYLFYGYGNISLKKPTALEFKKEVVSSKGMGIKYNFLIHGTSGSINIEHSWNKNSSYFNKEQKSQLLSVMITVQK